MALHLNLLHEEIHEQRQRQRDPLKIGMMVLGGLGALMFLWYMGKAYQTLSIRNRLNTVQQEWSKVEPKVTAAQKRSAELKGIIGTTKVLDEMIDRRFFWAPFLEKLSRCVALNAQVTSVDGNVVEEDKSVTVMIEGLAAGREPRAAAEELRQLLLEQLGQSYQDVKIEFKMLEDLDTLVKIGGANKAMARFALSLTFSPSALGKGCSSTPPRHQRNEETEPEQRPDPEARCQWYRLHSLALRLLHASSSDLSTGAALQCGRRLRICKIKSAVREKR